METMPATREGGNCRAQLGPWLVVILHPSVAGNCTRPPRQAAGVCAGGGGRVGSAERWPISYLPASLGMKSRRISPVLWAEIGDGNWAAAGGLANSISSGQAARAYGDFLLGEWLCFWPSALAASLMIPWT